jgi:hypothetical protein
LARVDATSNSLRQRRPTRQGWLIVDNRAAKPWRQRPDVALGWLEGRMRVA